MGSACCAWLCGSYSFSFYYKVSINQESDEEIPDQAKVMGKSGNIDTNQGESYILITIRKCIIRYKQWSKNQRKETRNRLHHKAVNVWRLP